MVIGNIVLDLVVLAILAISGIYWWKRGFIRGVLKTFAGLFSAMLSMAFFDNLAVVLKEKYVYGFVFERVEAALATLTAGVTPDAMVDAIPAGLKSAASLVGIDLLSMAEGAAINGQTALASFTVTASTAIAQLLASIAAFVLLFAVIFFVIRVLSVPIDFLISKIPVVNTVNSALGLAFGLVATVLLLWIAIQLFGFLDATMGFGFVEVEKAWISGIFYRISPFS